MTSPFARIGPKRAAATTAAILATGMALATAAPARAEDCPHNTISLGGAQSFTSPAAVFDSTSGPYRAAYDMPVGVLEILHCCTLGYTSVRVRDSFDLVGVPAGTELRLLAKMSIEGWVFTDGCGGSGCSGTLNAAIASGGITNEFGYTAGRFEPGRSPLAGYPYLQVTLVAGQPLTIEFEMKARRNPGSSHGVEATGRIVFDGIPQGAGVVSCRGYQQIPVPTRPTSWGRLKTLYR